MANETMGMKKRVEEVIKGSDVAMTLSEILKALDLNNTNGPEVSAALIKLVRANMVLAKSGPASSNLGPRWVKKYSWNQQRPRGAPPRAVKAEVPTVATLPRRVFNF